MFKYIYVARGSSKMIYVSFVHLLVLCLNIRRTEPLSISSVYSDGWMRRGSYSSRLHLLSQVLLHEGCIARIGNTENSSTHWVVSKSELETPLLTAKAPTGEASPIQQQPNPNEVHRLSMTSTPRLPLAFSARATEEGKSRDAVQELNRIPVRRPGTIPTTEEESKPLP